jgi:glycosyltransferase involved in cell wall biosynthesis
MKILCSFRYSRDKASSRVRGFYLAEELQRRGCRCKIVRRTGRGGYLNTAMELVRHNVIYFQKKYTRIDIRLNKLARSMGKKTIFDLDDAPFGNTYSTKASKLAVMMMKSSSAVFLGSHKLKSFAERHNDRTFLIPSSINLSVYKPQGEREGRHPVTLGWIGDGASYRDDLKMLIDPLERLGKEHRIKLVIVGALGEKEIHGAFGGLRSIDVQIIDSIDWADSRSVPSKISEFDIGLYPLLDTEFNKYKCGYKALEYMAMEIPVVASPVGENRYILEDGRDGLLASNQRQWYEKLSLLIESEEIRRRMGKAGRDKVEREYSLVACGNRVMNILGEI